MANKKIVFIHGLYMNGRSWAPWVEYASQRGYDAIAPSYPFHEGEPSFLRAHVEPAIGRLQFKDVLNTYKRYIDTLPERPILIGHSIGGLLVQKLVNDGYGSIGVAITPAPPTGIFSFSPTFFRANWGHVDPFAGNKPVIMTEKRFHYTFCNVQTRESSDVDFEKYVVPESRNIPRSTLTRQGKVDFKKDHVPLLLISAESDHLIPPSLVKKNFKKYRGPNGVVEYKEYPNRSHFICNQDGWQEVANDSFNWIESHS